MTALVVGGSFELEIDSIRSAAVRAIARAERKGTAPLDALLGAHAQHHLESTRELEYLFALRPDEVRFLWAVVAATVDPALALHLPRLGPRYGRTGISIAQFATNDDLERPRDVRLGWELPSASPLVRYRLIEPIDPPKKHDGDLANPFINEEQHDAFDDAAMREVHHELTRP